MIKLKKLVESTEAIKILAGLKLPVSLSYKLSLFLNKISPEITVWEEKRNALLLELGKPKVDEKGKEIPNTYDFEEGKGEEFNEKVNTILEEEVDVTIPEIKLKDLGKLEIEPKYLAALGWLIIE